MGLSMAGEIGLTFLPEAATIAQRALATNLLGVLDNQGVENLKGLSILP
jgi:hypothetical protein